MYLVVGLGNPGAEYENTRHNLGFRVVEELAARLNVLEFKEKRKLESLIGEGEYEGHKIIMAEPQTYMNLSGLAVSAIMNWYKIPNDRLIVAYDDVDLEVGAVRVRPRGAPGGHHGIESIIAHTHSSDFIRIRVGIGREGTSGDVSDYVLLKIPKAESELLSAAVARAADAVLSVISSGVEPAMNRFNA